MERKASLKKVKRVVVKVGTAILTKNNLELNTVHIRKLVREMAVLHKKGYELILVSSGAISVGAHVLGYTTRPKNLTTKQASAAVGQGRLVHIYQKLFEKHGINTAQVLLTRDDLASRERYVNAKNTLNELLSMKIIPVINENDTVAVEEIEFGDNDRLAAYCTHLIQADLLIILSDIEGLMTGDPRVKGKNCQTIPVVTKIDRDIEMMVEGTRAYRGIGGIRTKLDAAKIVVVSGEMMVLADGKSKDVLVRIMNGEDVGTIFYPHGQKMKHKKRWLAFVGQPKGKLVVDAGAEQALKNSAGRSLLASGILAVDREFQKCNVVDIVTEDGKLIARGRTGFSSQEIRLIRGKRTSEIKKLIDGKVPDEVIHRDELVVF